MSTIITIGGGSGAQADWNATSGDAEILNKPTLGTASAADVSDFATASQGELANTALQPGAIGVTVQGYSAILSGTTASFTLLDESKLDGIQSGAQVNNISDINAADLTDGSDTSLHTHDLRYYTETETDTFLLGKLNTNGNNGAITYTNFTPSSAPPYQEGRIWYDSTDKALSVYDNYSGTSLQLGKETVLDVRNNSGVQINNGQVVYFSGASGQLPTITLARADSLTTSQIIGVATHDIPNNSNGKITIFGMVNGLNTSAFADGAALYLSASTAGAMTATPPTSPDFVVFVGYVAHSHVSQGKLLVESDRPIASNTALGTSQVVAPTQSAVKSAIDSVITSVSSDGQIINSVAHFVRSTTPTVRVDGSALVVGDRWFNPTTGQQGFWNGTLWLGCDMNWTAGRRTSGTSAPNYTEVTEWNYALGQQTYISMANYGCTLATAGDVNNYHVFSVRAVLRDNTTSTVYTSTTKMFASGVNVVSSETPNILIPVTIGGVRVVGLVSTFTPIGTAPTISSIAHSIGWRLVL